MLVLYNSIIFYLFEFVQKLYCHYYNIDTLAQENFIFRIYFCYMSVLPSAIALGPT